MITGQQAYNLWFFHFQGDFPKYNTWEELDLNQKLRWEDYASALVFVDKAKEKPNVETDIHP
jgi:hypothetical protein